MEGMHHCGWVRHRCRQVESIIQGVSWRSAQSQAQSQAEQSNLWALQMCALHMACGVAQAVLTTCTALLSAPCLVKCDCSCINIVLQECQCCSSPAPPLQPGSQRPPRQQTAQGSLQSLQARHRSRHPGTLPTDRPLPVPADHRTLLSSTCMRSGRRRRTTRPHPVHKRSLGCPRRPC